MEIEPLEDGASAALISSLLGDDPSLEDLAPRILARTRGNPFFAEEVIESLAAGGQLEGGRGGYRLAGPVEDLEIPASVQVLLAARIDRLAERHKYVLQTASVIGRRFGRELLEAVVELPPDELADSLTALEAGDLVRATTLFPSPEYEFRHPLTHEVAYGMQLRDIRQRVHVEVARALEALHPDRLGELAALLAHHWDSAGHRFEARRWRQRVALRVSNIQIRRRRKRS